MATTTGDAEVAVGAVVGAAVGAVVSAAVTGVDKTAALVSTTMGCGCGATATDAIVSVVELRVENCAIEVDNVVAPAGGATELGAAVVVGCT